MLRILYSVILPFLLPFAGYWAYRLRRKKYHGSFPFQTLTAAGLVLVFVFLFVFSIPDKAPADSTYTPPKFENGQIVPAALQSKRH